MVLMEFSVTPLGQGESVGPYVTRCVEIVAASGLDYQLHAMGTIVEGELDQVLDLMKRCFEELQPDCSRITCTAKLDYRRGARGRIRSKVESVEEKMQRPSE